MEALLILMKVNSKGLMISDESFFQEKNADKSSFKNLVSNIRNLEINYQKDTGEINLLNDFTDFFLTHVKRLFRSEIMMNLSGFALMLQIPL